jgi:hypothetical protein
LVLPRVAGEDLRRGWNQWNFWNDWNRKLLLRHNPVSRDRRRWLLDRPIDNAVVFLLSRKNRVDDFLQALRDFFIIRQRLHYGDLTGEPRRDSRAH